MNKDNIERIIIEHECSGRGRFPDEWWEVTIVYYNKERERFILNNIDEVLSFMQKHRLEFK